MEFQVVIPVLDFLCNQRCIRTGHHPFLRRLKMGQTEKNRGRTVPFKESRNTYNGGVIFLIATAITALFYVGDYPKIIPVLFLTLGFGIIGFLDDYLKVVLNAQTDCCHGRNFYFR